ncbi:universal stress protein UspE [Thalassolituus sp. LLYu03]|uniref:universal stress protein UspE n=1 Tax=Thalassolituus sp. LLYu03 TaxID=3421656 RepID=UPI003D26E1F1
MLDINHILVVLDSSHPEQIALDRALWLASSLNADLTLLTATYEAYCEDNSSLDAETRQRVKGALISKGEQWLNSFVPEGGDVRISTEVHWQKHLHDAVMESMRQKDFDLVIKGTRPHGILDRIFTHTDWNLMRHCPAPVMLVKSAAAWKHNRVLAAIDATSSDKGHQLINDNILSFAEHLADHFETDLHLANSYPLVSVAFAMVPEVTAPDDIQKYITEQHDEACAAWARKFSIQDDHIHIGEGDADTVIASISKEIEADVVVMGTVGREGIAGVLIGNTAEALVDKLSCDIIVLKPSDGVLPDAD